jgi:hypothetical protein
MLSRQMAEAKKKDSEYHTVPDAAGRRTLRPVLLHYAIAQDGANGVKLLRVSLRFGEEALAVFSSWEAAQGFFLSDVFQGEWYARVCSAGELTSLLLGPYKGTKWVLLDPPPEGSFVEGDTQANLMRRERFVDHLLG